jgi:hypothetical protein
VGLPVCERFLGGVRHECLDPVIVLGEEHLRIVLRRCTERYFNMVVLIWGSVSASPRGEDSSFPVLLA